MIILDEEDKKKSTNSSPKEKLAPAWLIKPTEVEVNGGGSVHNGGCNRFNIISG